MMKPPRNGRPGGPPNRTRREDTSSGSGFGDRRREGGGAGAEPPRGARPDAPRGQRQDQGQQPRQHGSEGPRREGGPGGQNRDSRPGDFRREGGAKPARGGGFGPRREGGPGGQNRDSGPGDFRREGGAKPARGGGFGPRRESGPGGQNRDSGAGGQHREGGPGTQHREGGAGPARRGGGFGAPRREGGFAPRREGAASPREEGFGPRRGGWSERQPASGPSAPHGTVWLYGHHAVAAALANPSRRLRRLLLTEEAEQVLAARLRQPWPLAVERVDRARMEQLLGHDVVHQGAALLADPLSTPSLEKVLERPGPLLVLDQVSDPRNVGAILRSAAAFAAAGVIVQERNAPEETGALAKAASGALEHMPLLRAVNLARTLVALKAAGCWVVGLDASGPALSGPALAQRRVALVLGAEGEGLRRLTRETCDEVAGLSMPGAIDSLNVSAAASIALYELTRRG